MIARCVIYNRVTDQDGKNGDWRKDNTLRMKQYPQRALIDALIKGGHIDGYKRVGAGCGDARAFVDLEENSLSDRKFRIECDLDWDDTLSYQDSFNGTINPRGQQIITEVVTSHLILLTVL